MSKPKILIQLDTDPQPSVFDAVVAVDSGVEQLLRQAGVTAETAPALAHGAMFTRGPADLANTAIFIGGTDVGAGEAVLKAVCQAFFGPLRVSVMMDASGCNTTAAAAVLCAAAHMELAGATAVVPGGTGAVGQRVALLLARAGANVRVVSRDRSRAQAVCDQVVAKSPGAQMQAFAQGAERAMQAVLADAQIVVAAGKAGVKLATLDELAAVPSVRVAIDLNAVPPLGIEGIRAQDKEERRGHVVCYGALGVGGLKMKIHKAALRSLFQSNDRVLDTEEIFNLAQELKIA